jgi:hypothetical protein
MQQNYWIEIDNVLFKGAINERHIESVEKVEDTLLVISLRSGKEIELFFDSIIARTKFFKLLVE